MSQEQWQREYYLFNEILHIRLFRVYRIWKAFKVWRTYVRDFKMRVHSKSLEEKLFFLNGIFQRSLLEVRKLCTDVAFGEDRLRLQRLESTKSHSLEAFVEAQEGQSKEVVTELGRFNRLCLASVEQACSDTLVALEARLSNSSGFGDGAEAAHASSGDEAQQQVVEHFSYTVLAAKRAEHRKLHHFIRLADYVIRDTLHTMVVTSAHDLLQFMKLPRLRQSVESMQAEVDGMVEGPEQLDEQAAVAAAAEAASMVAAVF
eukprot:COSAG05_NODE_3428_length_2072_cov_3.125697_2_plen_259_part_01